MGEAVLDAVAHEVEALSLVGHERGEISLECGRVCNDGVVAGLVPVRRVV